MVECELPKLEMWVRFPSPAPKFSLKAKILREARVDRR